MNLFGRRKRLIARKVVDFSEPLADCSDPLAVGFYPDGSIYVAAGQTVEALAENRGLGSLN